MKYLRILFLLVLSVLAGVASAYEAAQIGGIYYRFGGSEATVTYKDTNYNSYSGAVVIPESVTYNNKIYSVTSIGDHAFYGCSGLISAIIPNSVKSIYDDAFYGCTSLTSINIPESMESIGNYAFRGCSNLISVSIPNSITSIGYSAFFKCSSLTTVSIGSGVTSIGYSAFGDCSGLTSIKVEAGNATYDSRNNSNAIIETTTNTLIVGCQNTDIPNSVTSIGLEAFRGCSNLASITIPDSVKSIGGWAFKDCSGLTSVTIDRGITNIDPEAFNGCSNITTLSLNCDSIGNWFGSSRENLHTITLGDNVRCIGESAFSKYTGLINVIVGSNMSSIGKSAFSDCNNLTSVTIGNNVTSIGEYAFNGCTSLISINIPNSISCISTGTFQNCFCLSSVTIPESVTGIGEYAFCNCTGLTSVTIGNNVTSIGNRAFYRCVNLTSVTLNSNSIVSMSRTTSTSMKSIFGDQVKTYVIGNVVTGIGDYAFYNCSNMSSITIPRRVTDVGESTFSGCSSLISVTLESNTIVSATRSASTSMKSIFGDNVRTYQIGSAVKSIGPYAFYGCRNMSNIIIPNSVTSIGDYAFLGCSDLTSIDIPDKVTDIGEAAFSYCDGLASITIPNSVTSIGSSAFSDCRNLTSITISNKVTSIERSTFFGCRNLIAVIIPDKVTNIGEFAFSDCSSLTSVTIPNKVVTIGNSAFSCCQVLDSVTIGSSVTNIEDKAFYCCSSLTSVTIPNSVTSIGNSAFYGCSALSFVTIGNGVTSIRDKAFSACGSLTSVTLESNALVTEPRTTSTSMKSIFGDQVKTYILGDAIRGIGRYAFYNSSNLTSIIIPNSLTSIGNFAFYGCNNTKIYVNRGTDGLLSVWNYGTDPYEKNTSNKLLRPSITVTSRTQTTIGYEINNIYPELEYDCVYSEAIGDNKYLIKGLRPECKQIINLIVSSSNMSYSASMSATTLPISPSIISDSITASSIFSKGSYIEGDAKVISQSIILNGTEINGAEGKVCGLKPNTSYNCRYKVIVEDDYGSTYSYEGSSNIRTASLTLTTQQPKVINVGNVILAAESNLDDEETNVRFEWRRIDWTDEFTSNNGVAYLYEGKMEGYIRNLYAEKLWKYRPYYESDSGNRYYGEWVGIDPTNISYFEPTVHTYATINVTGNTAVVKGYAMRGTDNVTSQGFIYWSTNSPSSLRKVNGIPSDAKTVIAGGNIMTATLENLEYETEYCCVAFVTTAEGETFYGESQIFRTDPVDPDGIKEIENGQLSTDNEAVAIYDLNGRKINKPQKGINIIRYSEGSSRKVLLK